MSKIPEKAKLKSITDYPSLEQLTIMKDICNKIYIARNITMSSDTILEQMERIDVLFRDKSNFN